MSIKIKQGPIEIIKNNLFLLKIALEEAPGSTLFGLIMPTFVEFTVYIEHVYLISYLIDCIEKQKPFINAVIFVIAVFLTITIRFLIGYFMDTKVSPKCNQKIFRRIRLELYEKAKTIDLSCYDNPEFYNDYVWAMNNATEYIWSTIYLFGCFISSIVCIIVMGAYIFTQNSHTIIAVTVSLIGTMLLDLGLGKLNFKLHQVLNPIFRKRDYINRVFYLNDYAKEIRLSNIKNKLINDYLDVEKKVQQEYRKTNSKFAILEVIKDYIFSFSVMDFFYILYLMFETVVRNSISFATMCGLYKTANSIKSQISRLVATPLKFAEQSLYIGKIKDFLNYENTVVSSASSKNIPEQLKIIELKNVSFSYDEKSEPVLRNINMKICPGEKIALVGYNGAGKTTLIKLIMRLYDVSSGEILYDGINIKEYDINEYRNIFSTLFQDHQIFATTVEQNITVGSEKVDKEKLQEVLEQSDLKQRVDKMRDGINTQLTNEFEYGIDLSDGEKQKLVISRCLYKDSKFIILDEPSSALDPIAEFKFNDMMLNLNKDKTVIFISHRLSTTKMADRIYMFENGKIIESGTHDQLMANNSKYAKMFLLQTQKYL